MIDIHKKLTYLFPDYSDGDWQVSDFGEGEFIAIWNRQEQKPDLTWVDNEWKKIEKDVEAAELADKEKKLKKYSAELVMKSSLAKLILGQPMNQDDINAATEYLS